MVAWKYEPNKHLPPPNGLYHGETIRTSGFDVVFQMSFSSNFTLSLFHFVVQWVLDSMQFRASVTKQSEMEKFHLNLLILYEYYMNFSEQFIQPLKNQVF